jgi:sortase A
MKFGIRWQMFLPPRPQSFLHWSQYVFFAFGILTLSYVGFVLLDARLYQAYQMWRFEKAVTRIGPSIGTSLHPSLLPAVVAEASRTRAPNLNLAVREGSPVGRIEISTIGLQAMILEGIDDGTLRRAVGHIPGTPLPGQQGNVAIAGHRDTFFRALRNIRKDDEITLATLSGSYCYRVDSIRVVSPEDIEVLDDSDGAILTLVTCYPFSFVGSAPKRFIVRAHRIHG